jgi:hypothetical protein
MSGRDALAVRSMHRQPHGRRLSLCRLHPMPHMRGDLDPIAGRHVDGDAALFEAQAGGASQKHDELVVGLVVPEAGRARLSGRDNALDAHAGALDQKVDLLLGLALGQRREKIAAAQIGTQPLKPAGASQGFVPITPGVETSRISSESAVRISLWRR